MKGLKGMQTVAVVGLTALALVWSARPARGQSLHGIITDQNGGTVAGAVVQLWQGNRALMTTETTATGRFAFPADSFARSTSIAVRAIGFVPRSVPHRHGQFPAMITLEAYAQPLPAILARAGKEVCPKRDELAAVRLWSAARQRYRLESLTSGFAIEGHYSAENVKLEHVNFTASQQFLLRQWSEAYGGRNRITSNRWMADSGYAFRKDERSTATMVAQPRFVNWWFARLDRWEADHFARPLFNEMNHLGLPSGDMEAGWIVPFCTEGRYRRRIVGVLQIGPDTTFRSARWRFLTPKPNEDAGGEVVFVVSRGGPLVPLRSLFWRRVLGAKDLYYREEAVVTSVVEYSDRVAR